MTTTITIGWREQRSDANDKYQFKFEGLETRQREKFQELDQFAYFGQDEGEKRISALRGSQGVITLIATVKPRTDDYTNGTALANGLTFSTNGGTGSVEEQEEWLYEYIQRREGGITSAIFNGQQRLKIGTNSALQFDGIIENMQMQYDGIDPIASKLVIKFVIGLSVSA